MKKNSILYFSIIILGISIHQIQSVGFIMGAVQFPHAIKRIPTLQIYTCGNKIPGELCLADSDNKQFVYQIPHVAIQPPLYIAITPLIDYKKIDDAENNTIDYLKIPTNTPYKLYEVTPNNEKDKNNFWIVKELILDPTTGRLPDETIIISYDPSYIDKIEGGNAFELPTIYLKPDLIDIVGSEALLHNASDALVIASINSNTLHACVHPTIKQKSHVTLVAPII